MGWLTSSIGSRGWSSFATGANSDVIEWSGGGGGLALVGGVFCKANSVVLPDSLQVGSILSFLNY